MSNYDLFYQFMAEYVSFLENMLSVEKEKLEALLSHDLKRIEQSISAQQATAMKLENYEKKRTELQCNAGFPNKTLKEIVTALDNENAAALEKLSIKMENAIKNIRFYNDKSLKIVKMNLQTINGADSLNNRTEAKGYTSAKEQVGIYKGSPLFETKI